VYPDARIETRPAGFFSDRRAADPKTRVHDFAEISHNRPGFLKQTPVAIQENTYAHTPYLRLYMIAPPLAASWSMILAFAGITFQTVTGAFPT